MKTTPSSDPPPGVRCPTHATTVDTPTEPGAPANPPEAPTLGRYRLLQRLGEGGSGIVYLAEQIEPVRRRVALKLLKLGMDSRQAVARFEAERQALALMDHPNIARVLDAGTLDVPEIQLPGPDLEIRHQPSGILPGRPFFVMELVRGIRITGYCDQNQLSIRQRLELFIQVCHAVQHAHQKGIIHRDIKPSNILVARPDEPAAGACPKVIDFGIAKTMPHLQPRLTDNTVHTQWHHLVGTPAYMSPEQAGLSPAALDDVDTRSDIYSLGVLLHELLTGRTPFDTRELMARGLDALRRTIREEEPLRPSIHLARLDPADLSATARRRASDGPRLIHLLKGDLDWIVLKCLEKDRARRYETASSLAEDIRSHLDHQPVIARPPTPLYRLQKAWRRHRLVYSSAAAITATLLLAVVISATSYLRERQARRNEQLLRQTAESLRLAAELSAAGERQQRARAEALAYANDMNLILQALEMNNLGRGLELLNRNRPAEGQIDRRGWEWRHLWMRSRSDERLTLGTHPHAVSSLAFSPLEDLLASGALDGTLKLWDLNNPVAAVELNLGSQVHALAFSPDGRLLAARTRDHGCQLWELPAIQEIARLDAPTEGFGGAVAFSPEGDRLAVCGATSDIQLWDLPTRTLAATLSGHHAEVRALVFARDGQTLYSASIDSRILVWDLATQQSVASLGGHTQWITSLCLAPDQSVLASASGDGTVRIWDLTDRQERARLDRHASLVWDVRFSPDGRLLATCGADQRIRLWDTVTWEERHAFKGHLSEVWRLAFSPDGDTLASGGKDETVRLWNPNPKTHAPDLRAFPPEGNRAGIILSPDARWFARATPDNQIHIGHTQSLRDIQSLPALAPFPSAVLIDPANHRLYFGHPDGSLHTRNLQSGQPDISLTGHEAEVVRLALSNDGNRLASVARDRSIHIQTTDTARLVTTVADPDEGMSALAFAPDGSLLASASHDDRILIHQLDAAMPRVVLPGHKGRIAALAFSPDGSLLASASWDGTAGLWDLAARRRRATLRAHLLGVNSVAFTPDGQRLVGGTGDGFIKVWNIADGQEVLTLVGWRDINHVAFIPGTETLVSVTLDAIQLWPAPTLGEIAELERRHAVATY